MLKVSVIVPTHNSAKYLPNAIDSILAQTYQDFEIIIVDDGSSDNTREIIKNYLDKYSNKITYIYQRNKGSSAARNTGVKNAKGEYIAFLDSDDIWLSEMLEKTVPLLNRYDWVVTSGNHLMWNKNGSLSNKTADDRSFLNNVANLYHELLKEDIIGSPSKVILNKRCFEIAGFFDESLNRRQDWDLWIRLAKYKLKIIAIADQLYIYNIYEEYRDRRRRSNEHILNHLCCTHAVINKNRLTAFKIDHNFKHYYGKLYWDLARIAFYKAKNLKLSIIFIFKSLLCEFNIFRLLKSSWHFFKIKRT